MIEIIPAIDLIDGCCVRLTQGDYAQTKVYDCSPVDMAKRYADCGIKRLHIVDLDGAKAKYPNAKNLKTLENIASATSLDIEWGGGIKSEETLCTAINAGASRIICGSVAVENPEMFAFWLRNYGANRMILGADVRNGKVATNGWLKDSETGVAELMEKYMPYGLSQMICTDINRDGTLEGPDLSFYTSLQQRFMAVDVTLSGGISSMQDIISANDAGIRAVITGKAVYEGKITLKEIEQWLQNV